MDNNSTHTDLNPDLPEVVAGEGTRSGGAAPRLAWHTPAVMELKASTHTLNARHGAISGDFFSYTS